MADSPIMLSGKMCDEIKSLNMENITTNYYATNKSYLITNRLEQVYICSTSEYGMFLFLVSFYVLVLLVFRFIPIKHC